MKKGISLGLSAMLMACGVAATTSNDAAESATQRARPKARPQRPILDDMRFDRGGMAGCFDPNLSGYARRAAEEIGGVPCDTPRRATTNGAGSLGASSIVGMWVMQDGYCASGDPIAFERDGSYATNELDARGRWTLSGDRLSIVYREVDEESGDPVGPEHRMAYRVTRVNLDEIRLDADRYRRCPRGGGEPWHPRR